MKDIWYMGARKANVDKAMLINHLDILSLELSYIIKVSLQKFPTVLRLLYMEFVTLQMINFETMRS